MKATIQFISDRQDLIESMKLRELGLESYALDRLDMYWIEVETTQKGHVTYSVDPIKPTKEDLPEKEQRCWSLTRQYGEYSEETYKFAEKFFSNSEYEKNMKKWIENLKDVSYFTEGRYGSKKANTCPHCRSSYKIGTSHEHISYNNRIVSHSARLYKTAVELGLKPNWRSSLDAQEMSLEEKGELTPVIIPSIH